RAPDFGESWTDDATKLTGGVGWDVALRNRAACDRVGQHPSISGACGQRLDRFRFFCRRERGEVADEQLAERVVVKRRDRPDGIDAQCRFVERLRELADQLGSPLGGKNL